MLCPRINQNYLFPYIHRDHSSIELKLKFSITVVLLDSGVQCSAELEALYDVYMEQSADFEQRENSASAQENGQGSLNTLQKVNFTCQLD